MTCDNVIVTWRDDPERRRAYRTEYRKQNRDKINAQSRSWRARHPEKVSEWNARDRDKNRMSQMRRNHGMEPGDWAALWESQDGCCYLCGSALVDGKIHIDHDHSCCGSKRSCLICRRGLSCGLCNHAIGMAADDPDRLRRMADALEMAKRGVVARMAERGPVEQLPLPGFA
jgi:hypothetical protein